MAKTYVINCREVGVDCDFEARGANLDEVIEQCADHGKREHNMHAFGPDMYAKMRSCLKVIEEDVAERR